jgi:diaminohydroxyphosphoribosylaminopyrimidine deaminase/5-amino-6-(5-phosphoribosylamino)uracil reductase
MLLKTSTYRNARNTLIFMNLDKNFDASREGDQPPMRLALELACAARFDCPPNPAVGCVIVNKEGRVIGQGATQVTGGPHAEVMALRQASADSRGALKNATAYVTLEPCAHQGRTPPCADALIAAGLQRVVAAIEDPDPRVAGKGIEKLRAAGLTVDVGLMAQEALDINRGFFSRILRGRPWVRLKIAASADGKTALLDGRSQWITQEAARQDGHLFRAQAGAILTGIGTVLADDPRLDVRLPTATAQRQPLRVIVDSKLRMSENFNILRPPGAARIYTAIPIDDRHAKLEQSLHALGVTLRTLPNERGQVDLGAMLHQLGQEDSINELHVEAGPTLNGALLQGGWVDEVLLYIAPKFLGPGKESIVLPPLDGLEQALSWQWKDLALIGQDVRLRGCLQPMPLYNRAHAHLPHS